LGLTRKVESIMRYKAFLAVLVAGGLTGCAGVTPKGPSSATPGVSKATTPPSPAAPPQQIIIYIPQTDQSAQSWFKLLDRFPSLKMVIAFSPRFQRFVKEPLLKDKALALQKEGRLEIALQLPNAPFLPLIINSDSAKAATPPGTPLPYPAFAHPEDVIQIYAKNKADFTKIWGASPKGFVLPLGAINPDLVKLLNRSNLTWVVGALGAPGADAAYRSGSLIVLDAIPAKESPRFGVQVWDERITGNPTQSLQTLTTWAQNMTKTGMTAALPSNPDLPVVDLPAEGTWGNRTWTTPDWTPWIGSARKNAAWTWLQTTRDALEKFKNSGQASVRRLDMAFEEIYNAENANYFSGLTEGETTFTLSDEREREFKATLSSVYRLIGQAPPDNLFSTDMPMGGPAVIGSSTSLKWETLPDGRNHVILQDAPNDAFGDGHLASTPTVPSSLDLQRVEVYASTETLEWVVTLGTIGGSNLGNFQTPGPVIDIYVDLNGQPNVGTVSLMPGRGTNAAASNAWEYAFTLWGNEARFYRTQGSDNYELSDTFPLSIQGNQVRFRMPLSGISRNPQRWAYQVLMMAYDQKSLESDPRPQISPEMAVAHRLPIYDLIDPLDIPQSTLLTSIEEGKRNDIPFVRLPSGQASTPR
jgi:hypothetical protein